MKNIDLMGLLQKYPKNADVSILGWEYAGCGQWDCEYFYGVKVDFDEKYNELFLEGVEE